MVCALCLAALVVLGALTTFTLVPAAMGWRPDVILTGSMAPAIMPGDVVVSAPIKPRDIIPGRVLLVDNPLRPGELLLHRAVSITSNGSIITRGDANQSADSAPVPIASVRGLPRLRVPMIGLPALWVRDQQWGRLAGATGGILLALWGGLSRRREDDEHASAVGHPETLAAPSS